MTPKSLRNDIVAALKDQADLNVYCGRLIASDPDDLPAAFVLVPSRTTHAEHDDHTDQHSDITALIELGIPANQVDSLNDLDDYIEDILSIVIGLPLIASDATTVRSTSTNVDIDNSSETILAIAQLQINLTYEGI